MQNGLEFASGYVHPLDRYPSPKRLEDVIAESEQEARRKKLSQSYRTPRTEAVAQTEARRYPEQELQPLPQVPVAIDEIGQYGWLLEPGWKHQQ